MRPKAGRKNIPSTHDITTYIHNEFVKWLKELEGDIKVSQKKTTTKNDYLPGHNRKLLARSPPQLMGGQLILRKPRSLV
jgi:hypothetical protein